MAEATFGQKVVGLNFNPSGNPSVTRVKEIIAEAIDLVINEGRGFNQLAIDELILAQMTAVKSLTWTDGAAKENVSHPNDTQAAESLGQAPGN